VTERADSVLVYVDEKGEPYLTTTEAKVASTSSAVLSTTPAAAPSTTSVSSPAPQVPSASAAPVPPIAPASSTMPSFDFSVSVKKQEAQTTTTPLAPSSTPEKPSSSPAAAPSPSAPDVPAHKSDDAGVLGLGITYDPFAGASTNSRCKSDDEFAADFEKMKEYKVIRLYGQGCNQIPQAVKAALKQNQKLMAGTYMSNNGEGEELEGSIRAWKSAIDSYANGNWDVVSLFSVENERVNDHDMTASSVVDAINRARTKLRAAGYNGPVGAVETVPAMVDNPSICEASDVVMVNCHAFFDTNTTPDNAGKFVRSEINRVQRACNGKRVVVTESGWPHQGATNGQAVPSPENQRIALDSIRTEFTTDMLLHNAFDSSWKSDSAATFEAERYWGVIQ
jgi:exo-beta-1,3-glucanase (GH17 family)